MSEKSIDDEFAELEKELDRLTALPPTGVRDTSGIVLALGALKQTWDKRLETRFDRPVWQRKIDEAIARALSQILQAGQTIDRHGNLGFALDAAQVKEHAAPVVSSVMDGLEQEFMDKWVKKPAEPGKAPEVDAKDLGGLLSMLLRPQLKKK